jgi:hypothetical protein
VNDGTGLNELSEMGDGRAMELPERARHTERRPMNCISYFLRLQ